MKNFINAMLGTIVGSIIYQVGLLLVVDNEVRRCGDDLCTRRDL